MVHHIWETTGSCRRKLEDYGKTAKVEGKLGDEVRDTVGDTVGDKAGERVGDQVEEKVGDSGGQKWETQDGRHSRRQAGELDGKHSTYQKLKLLQTLFTSQVGCISWQPGDAEVLEGLTVFLFV